MAVILWLQTAFSFLAVESQVVSLVGASAGATAWSWAWAAFKLFALLSFCWIVPLELCGMQLKNFPKISWLGAASLQMTFAGLLVEGILLLYRCAHLPPLYHPGPSPNQKPHPKPATVTSI